ncbi:unnamed protein product [Cylindrotheca closterium]|uniref:Uncharacterized protein n=1 Tax=Cylindrotheca closterium TaxID=2856 RepID=A0AAD2CHF3_9STRA|nr:unnamed protein product [Cylindrotheca closterium]
MSSIPEGGRMALSPSPPSESSTALSESSTNENNNQFTSITVEFIYSGESSSSSSSTKNGARKRITKAPAAVQKLLIRPTAASLPNRLCEKCHDLHEVVMIEQEEDHEAIIVNSSITILQTNTIKPACQLKTIGDYAFAECIKLPRISIAWSVETIGKNSFARCNQLVQVDLNAAVSKLKHIGFCSFYQCTALARIYIPSTVEEIEGHAFHGCRSLKEVKLLAAFEQPKDEELRLGSLVVGPSAFLDCSSFEKIKIPSSLEKLPKSCFHSCSNLKQVSLPEGLKKIKASSFLNCISLNYVKIPSTVETIEQDSFKGCSALEGVDFGSPHHQQQQQQSSLLKHMEWEAFMDCIALRKMWNYRKDRVQEIQHSAFGNCLALQAVILPQSVELVGIRAFASCPRLVTVEIPPTGMSPQFRIRKDAFVHCKAMINVSLPRSLSEEYKIHGLDNRFGSGFGENGFQGCTWLEQQYGRDLAPFFMGEVSRFGDDYPIHKLCYHSSATSVQTLRKAIQNHQVAKKDDRNDIVDDFGMSPFHILLTAGKRRVDLLEVLLETYPSYILGWEDVTGKKAIEYCFLGWNWTIESMYMVQLCLQNYVTRRLSMWGGSTVWDTDLTAEINSILSEDNNERQQLLWRATFATFQVFEQVEGVSVLELALWKREIFEQSNGDLAQDAAEREVHRARCGSSFVIPNVVSFLELG